MPIRTSCSPLAEQELFKMAPQVVERRAKGLDGYMSTIIRRFPDMLESPHVDRYSKREGSCKLETRGQDTDKPSTFFCC